MKKNLIIIKFAKLATLKEYDYIYRINTDDKIICTVNRNDNSSTIDNVIILPGDVQIKYYPDAIVDFSVGDVIIPCNKLLESIGADKCFDMFSINGIVFRSTIKDNNEIINSIINELKRESLFD